MNLEILTARFTGWGSLAAQSAHVGRNGLFLPEPSPPPAPLSSVNVRVVAPDGQSLELRAQVVQLAPGVGVALTFDGRASAAGRLQALVAHATEAAGEDPGGQTVVEWDPPAVSVAGAASADRLSPRGDASDEDDPRGADLGGELEPDLEEEGADHATLQQQIRAMTTPEKMRLAMHGDRPARMALMKDTNKTVQLFVIQNKRITLGEVLYLAAFRQANPEALARIAENREWVGHPGVLSALVANPKTPTTTALKLLRQLGQGELRRLAKSPNTPRAVAQAAKRLVVGS